MMLAQSVVTMPIERNPWLRRINDALAVGSRPGTVNLSRVSIVGMGKQSEYQVQGNFRYLLWPLIASFDQALLPNRIYHS